MYEGVIAKGIERLTERFGWEWVEWVDWEILRMDCYTKCVAGQIGTRLDADSYYYSTLRSLDVEFLKNSGSMFPLPTSFLFLTRAMMSATRKFLAHSPKSGKTLLLRSAQNGKVHLFWPFLESDLSSCTCSTQSSTYALAPVTAADALGRVSAADHPNKG
jgi:hypothetical protein